MAVTIAETCCEAWPSAVRSPYGYGVPRRFLWLADFVVPVVSFMLARLVAPSLQQLVAEGGILHSSVVAWLSIPGGPGGRNPLNDVLWIVPVMVCTTVVFMELLGGYRPLLEQPRWRLLATSAAAPFLALSVISLILITLKLEQISRAFVFSLALFTAVGMVAYRLALRHYKHRRLLAGCYARSVIVIGSPAAVSWLEAYFGTRVPAHFYRLRGYLLPAAANAAPWAASAAAGIPEATPYLGAVHDLADLVVHRPIHEVIAVESEGSAVWLGEVTEQCEYYHVTLRIVPEVLLQAPWRWNAVEAVRSRLNLPAVVLRAPHFDTDALFAKRLFDVVVSATLLALLSPLFVLIAIAIKLSTPHLPVLYPWRVVGYKGRKFIGYKFTTMQADADDRKGELMHLNEMSGPVFKIAADPRVTPLGKFLRKFSLNELPQLWSVLKGDMSLVGPRPAYPNELARYELWHKRKLCVQPGITCLWQIRGRNKIADFDEWVRMDFEYIDNWSLWLDFAILARTLLAVVRGTGS